MPDDYEGARGKAEHSLSQEEIIALIGDRGERAYDDIAKQFPDVFQGMPTASFLSIYNAAFLIGFRNAEMIYKARLLGEALEADVDEGSV